MLKQFLTLFIIVAGSSLAGCTAVSPPTSFDTSAPPPPGQTALVEDVIDGDTIDVIINGQSYRVRYIGVDTPERGEDFYGEATQANRQMVSGQEIILVKDVSETDQYGRLLRYIYLPDGTFVNAELLRQGVAQIVTYPPDVAMQDTFQDIQADARGNGRGLWSQFDPDTSAGCTCNRNAYNCADFTSQASAQSCYNICWDATGEDIHHLDGGGDGIVCESLP